MLYLYIQNSGDLGFDFDSKKTSNFFSVCALVVKGQSNDRAIGRAVKRLSKCCKPEENALPLGTLRELYKSVKRMELSLFSVTLDKKKAFARPSFDKDRLFSYIAGLVIKGIDFKDTAVNVTMSADNFGQGRGEIQFSDLLRTQVQGRVRISIPLKFLRVDPRESAGLQAAGLFARGLHAKHEDDELKWYSVFREKIGAEIFY